MIKCPKCQKEFEKAFVVHTGSMEPFTATAYDVNEGLMAYGTLQMPKTILCEQDNFVHFQFLDDGEERLVEMRKYDPVMLEQARDRVSNESHNCQHEGCDRLGSPRYEFELDMEPAAWYCDEHATEGGYCWSCDLLAAGKDRFDVNGDGLCQECRDNFDSDQDFGDDDEDYDPGEDYDDDMDFDEEDPFDEDDYETEYPTDYDFVDDSQHGRTMVEELPPDDTEEDE